LIDTKALRSRVLDLAIRGKLTEQLESDGTAEELYQQIQTEKQKLIKEDKISPKPIPNLTEADIPFEIPKEWKFVKFGDVSYIVRGGSPRPIKAYMTSAEDGINWIKIGDVEKGGKYIYETKEKIKPEGEKKSRKVFSGDFLLTNSMSFGRPYISKIEGCIHDGWLLIRNLNGFDVDYLYYLLSSAYLYEQFSDKASGSTVNNLNIDKVNSAIIPLPPLAEQKRIVARVEEIFRILDTIDEAQQKYSADVESLKAKLITAGIQGKLTEQLESDGTAEELYQQIQTEKQKLIKEGKIKKEKPLPSIKPEEVPFEIPSSWKWVYLGEIFQHNTGKALNSANKEGTLLDYITTSNVYWEHFELKNLKQMYFTDEEIDKCTVTKGDLLICEGGDIGRSAIWNFDYDMRIQNHLHRLRGYISNICVKYYYYLMWLYKETGKIDGRGIGLQGFSSKRVHSLIVPLPPLAEQKRIANKLDELLIAMQ